MKDLLAEAMIRFDELYARAMESGLRVRPERVEFWRGIENRLHERTLYWEDEGKWRRVLLYP